MSGLRGIVPWSDAPGGGGGTNSAGNALAPIPSAIPIAPGVPTNPQTGELIVPYPRRGYNRLARYPRGLMPRMRPYGANAYDDCLDREYRQWQRILACGGLRACCPQGRKQYTSPPWVSMPSEGRRFRPIAVAPLTQFQTGGNFNGLDTIVLQERVPLGYNGVIHDVVCEFTGNGFDEGSGTITWRLAADYLPLGGTATGGRYLRDMGNIITTLGSLTQPSPVPRGGLRVYSYDLITFYANVAVGAGIANGNIICSISGWWWPR